MVAPPFPRELTTLGNGRETTVVITVVEEDEEAEDDFAKIRLGIWKICEDMFAENKPGVKEEEEEKEEGCWVGGFGA